MKCYPIVFFYLLYFFSSFVCIAQIDHDGKTVAVEVKNDHQLNKNNTLLFTLHYSDAMDFIPGLGIKYQYCKSFGGYISMQTSSEFSKEEIRFSLGLAKSLSKNINLYFGFGKQFNLPSSGIDLETGVMYKNKRIAIDLGVGIGRRRLVNGDPNMPSSYYDASALVLSSGIGLNF